MTFVHLHERAGDGEAKSACLAADSTALEVRLDVELAESVGGDERLLDLRDEHRTREVVTERAPVDVPLAGACLHVNAANRFFAAADGMCHVGHGLLLALVEGQLLGLLG